MAEPLTYAGAEDGLRRAFQGWQANSTLAPWAQMASALEAAGIPPSAGAVQAARAVWEGSGGVQVSRMAAALDAARAATLPPPEEPASLAAIESAAGLAAQRDDYVGVHRAVRAAWKAGQRPYRHRNWELRQWLRERELRGGSIIPHDVREKMDSIARDIPVGIKDDDLKGEETSEMDTKPTTGTGRDQWRAVKREQVERANPAVDPPPPERPNPGPMAGKTAGEAREAGQQRYVVLRDTSRKTAPDAGINLDRLEGPAERDNMLYAAIADARVWGVTTTVYEDGKPSARIVPPGQGGKPPATDQRNYITARVNGDTRDELSYEAVKQAAAFFGVTRREVRIEPGWAAIFVHTQEARDRSYDGKSYWADITVSAPHWKWA